VPRVIGVAWPRLAHGTGGMRRSPSGLGLRDWRGTNHRVSASGGRTQAGVIKDPTLGLRILISVERRAGGSANAVAG